MLQGKGREDASSFISDVRVLWMFAWRDCLLDYRAGDYLQQGQRDGQSIEWMRTGERLPLEKRVAKFSDYFIHRNDPFKGGGFAPRRYAILEPQGSIIACRHGRYKFCTCDLFGVNEVNKFDLKSRIPRLKRGLSASQNLRNEVNSKTILPRYGS